MDFLAEVTPPPALLREDTELLTADEYPKQTIKEESQNVRERSLLQNLFYFIILTLFTDAVFCSEAHMAWQEKERRQ